MNPLIATKDELIAAFYGEAEIELVKWDELLVFMNDYRAGDEETSTRHLRYALVLRSCDIEQNYGLTPEEAAMMCMFVHNECGDVGDFVWFEFIKQYAKYYDRVMATRVTEYVKSIVVNHEDVYENDATFGEYLNDERLHILKIAAMSIGSPLEAPMSMLADATGRVFSNNVISFMLCTIDPSNEEEYGVDPFAETLESWMLRLEQVLRTSNFAPADAAEIMMIMMSCYKYISDVCWMIFLRKYGKHYDDFRNTRISWKVSELHDFIEPGYETKTFEEFFKHSDYADKIASLVADTSALILV